MLKHDWLFLPPLDSVSKLPRLVAFYVEEYDARTPHAALRAKPCGDDDSARASSEPAEPRAEQGSVDCRSPSRTSRCRF